MRVIVFSDSMALPRDEGSTQQLRYEQTWPYLLQQRMSNLEIIRHNQASATTKDICQQLKYWKKESPDLVIVQVGVVDAVPRSYHSFERRLIFGIGKRVKFVDKVGKFLAPKLRSIRNVTLVSPADFRMNLSSIRESFPKVLFIPILSDGEAPRR